MKTWDSYLREKEEYLKVYLKPNHSFGDMMKAFNWASDLSPEQRANYKAVLERIVESKNNWVNEDRMPVIRQIIEEELANDRTN